MAAKNSDHSYGYVAKAFHWGMFLILLGLVVLGIYMSDLSPETPDQMREKFAFYDWHRSFGLLILLLVVFRLGWRLINPVPKLPTATSRIEVLSAHIVHGLLYVMMFIQPITGWIMSSLLARPVKFFGLELPALADKNKDLGKVFEETHEIIGYILIFVFVIHMGAALFHHFIRKDDVLRRMVPGMDKPA